LTIDIILIYKKLIDKIYQYILTNLYRNIKKYLEKYLGERKMQNKIVMKGILFILLLMLCALPITPKTAIEDDRKKATVTAEEEKIEEAILETAALEEEIELAITKGLAWLAEQQCDDGGWICEWPQDRVGFTG
jgi:hypothetical protein